MNNLSTKSVWEARNVNGLFATFSGKRLARAYATGFSAGRGLKPFTEARLREYGWKFTKLSASEARSRGF